MYSECWYLDDYNLSVLGGKMCKHNHELHIEVESYNVSASL